LKPEFITDIGLSCFRSSICRKGHKSSGLKYGPFDGQPRYKYDSALISSSFPSPPLQMCTASFGYSSISC
jgi:hypothetical protein